MATNLKSNKKELEKLVKTWSIDASIYRNILNSSKLDELNELLEGIVISDTNHNQNSVNNVLNFMFTATNEIGLLYLLIADNLIKLRKISDEKQHQEFAKKALSLIAPLADRIGLSEVKKEIEEIAFNCAFPVRSKQVIELTNQKLSIHEDYIEYMKSSLAEILSEEKVIEIDGRIKNYYSVFRKLKKVNGDIDKIYDLIAFRVVLDNEVDCYRILGIIHKEFKPLIHRIKDYIALPKPNGYQSLHTTVFGYGGKIAEIQIRTKSMHNATLMGPAAQSIYSGAKNNTQLYAKSSKSIHDDIALLAQSSKNNDIDFSEIQSTILFSRIYVFSPKGEIYELPEGSTGLDFAYKIHTDIGNKAKSIIVNGEYANISYELKNRDVVEILTTNNNIANPSWLNIAKTQKAKEEIRRVNKLNTLSLNRLPKTTLRFSLTNIAQVKKSMEYLDNQKIDVLDINIQSTEEGYELVARIEKISKVKKEVLIADCIAAVKTLT